MAFTLYNNVKGGFKGLNGLPYAGFLFAYFSVESNVSVDAELAAFELKVFKHL